MHTTLMYYVLNIVLHYVLLGVLNELFTSYVAHSVHVAHHYNVFASANLHYKEWSSQTTPCIAKASPCSDEGRGYSFVPARHGTPEARTYHHYFRREYLTFETLVSTSHCMRPQKATRAKC